MKIKNLKENVINEIDLLVMSVDIKLSKKKDHYAKIIFSDSINEIVSFVWQIDPKNVPYEIGSVYKIFCYKQEFNNNANIKIIESTVIEDQEIISNFVKSAVIPTSEIEKFIDDKIQSISNIELKEITTNILNKYRKNYFISPAAAKNHHAYTSGMSYHVYNMLKILDLFSNSLNKDVLISGIVLHDIGKCFELRNDMVITYTTPGELLGHISIGYEIIYQELLDMEINPQEYKELLNLIIAHHGKLEYGNIKIPETNEEQVINIIDTIDANLNAFIERLEGIEDNHWSENIFPLSNRKVYNHNIESSIELEENDIFDKLVSIYIKRYDKINIELINIVKKYNGNDLVESYEKLIKEKNNYSNNIYRLLKHILLSRDLDISKQSPVLPKIIEAELFGSANKIINYNIKVTDEQKEK